MFRRRNAALPLLSIGLALGAPHARAGSGSVVEAWCAERAQASAGPAQMSVARVEGEAFRRETGVDSPLGGPVDCALAPGQPLHEGDHLLTLEGARVEIDFASGTVVRLGESTDLILRESPPEGGRFRARLVLGNFWAHVHKLLGGETFEVETENAVAGVRGTEFRLEVTIPPIAGDTRSAAARQQDEVAGMAPKATLLRVYEGVVQIDGEREGAKFTHRVEPHRELRVDAQKRTDGPREFAAASERGNRFVEWSRANERAQDGSEQRERKRQRREERRERRRQRLRDFFRKQ